MAVTYKKLFKLLIDRKMKKKELCEQAKVSTATVSKLANDENVTGIKELVKDGINT